MICPLDDEVRSQLRSGVAITSFTQCVEELALNSVDAGASCIALCVDIPGFRVQVVDNGSGIARNDLEQVGQRYSTSKCHSLHDLKQLRCHGYRGEALASLREISGVLEIVTRHKSSYKTLCSMFVNRKSVGVRESCFPRANVGTTITVHDLFSTLPVRRKVISEVLEFERIRQRVAAMALIHPDISFSLRNDASQVKCLQTHKSQSLRSTFTQLYGNLKSKGLREVCHEMRQFKITGFISVDTQHNKSLQFIYINSRLVLKTKIHRLVGSILNKSSVVKKLAFPTESENLGKTNMESPDKQVDKYGIFALNITCPLDEYDITLEPAKTLVEFQDWEELLVCIENCVQSFLVRENLVLKVSESDCSESQDDESQNGQDIVNSTSTSQGSFSIFEYQNSNSLGDKAEIMQISTSSVSKSLHSSTVCRRNKVTISGVSSWHATESNEARCCNQTGPECNNIGESTGGCLPSNNNIGESTGGCLPSSTVVCVGHPTESVQSDLNLSDSVTSVDDDNQQPVNHLSLVVDPTTLVEKAALNHQIQKKLIDSTATASQNADKTQDERGISSEQQGEEAAIPPQGHEHTGLTNCETFDLCSSKETENDSANREEIVNIQERANVSHHSSASVDFKEKLRRLKHDCNARSNVLEASNKQHKSCALQQFRARNQSAHRDHLKHSCARASHSVGSPSSSAHFENSSSSSCSFTSPHPITLQGLQSRKRYSKCTSELYPDQPDNEPIPLKARKKIALHRDSSGIHSSVSKFRRKNNSTENKNDSSDNNQESNQVMSQMTCKLPVDKCKDIVGLPQSVTATTHCSSNTEQMATCTSFSGLSYPTQNFAASASTFTAASCEQDDTCSSSTTSKTLRSVCLDACYNKSDPSISYTSTSSPNFQEGHQFPETSMLVKTGSSACVTTSNTFVQSLVIPNPNSSTENKSCTTEVTVLSLSKDNNSSCSGPTCTSYCKGNCGESAVNVKARAEYSEMDHSRSPVDNQSSNVDCLLDKETEYFGSQPLCSEESLEQTSGTADDICEDLEHAVSSTNMSSNQDRQDDKSNMETITNHNSPNREVEWIHTYDATRGRKIYVNLRTGNCSFDPPLGTGSKQDEMKEDLGYNRDDHEMDGFKQRVPHPQVPHLSFNYTPWLPRADRNKANDSITNTSTDGQSSTIAMMCEEHIQRDDTDELCKWKDPSVISASHELHNETVSTMLQVWENPTFQVPEKEIMNLNKATCGKSEVRVHNVIFPYRFTKNMLNKMQVINQVDDKFIVCLLRSEGKSRSCARDEDDLLVLVDQHAAHERVRLEQLQADLYEQVDSKISIKSSPISPVMEISLTQDEVRLLKNYQAEFKRTGIQFEIDSNTNASTEAETLVRINGLPSVFVERELSEVRRGRPSVAHSIVKGLIKEHLEQLSSTGGVPAAVPKTISRVLNSQACHGAVKFGEPLNVADCEKLMESLAKCSLPFQCAHGRPSVVPLVDLKLIENKYRHKQDYRPRTGRLGDWARKQQMPMKEKEDTSTSRVCRLELLENC